MKAATIEVGLTVLVLAIGSPMPDSPAFRYAGVMRGEAGQADYHLFALTGAGAAKLKGAWGEYGTAVPDTKHCRDGQANTKAMAAAGSKLAKKVIAAGAYIASQAEAALCAANLHEEFPAGYHWTSTQDSPRSAWVQGFEDGYSGIGSKGNEFRAVAVRRLEIQAFGPSMPAGADVGTAA